MSTTTIDINDDLYEIVDGKRIVLTHNPYEGWLVSRIAFPLGNHTDSERLGWSAAHMLFHLPSPINRDRRPDFSFVSYDRWPRNRPLPYTEDAWNIIPNLAVEIVSPTDSANELQQKIAEYFQAGVQLVWIVYPAQQTIHVYNAWTKISMLTKGDALDGDTVVLGFRLSLAELFPEVVEPAMNGAK